MMGQIVTEGGAKDKPVKSIVAFYRSVSQILGATHFRRDSADQIAS
jgi:hypothetical protein